MTNNVCLWSFCNRDAVSHRIVVNLCYKYKIQSSLIITRWSGSMLQVQNTVKPRYNAVVGVHDFGPRCTQGTLGVPISATRELLNN